MPNFTPRHFAAAMLCFCACDSTTTEPAGAVPIPPPPETSGPGASGAAQGGHHHGSPSGTGGSWLPASGSGGGGGSAGAGIGDPVLTVVATADSGLATPRDLDFASDGSVWIVNDGFSPMDGIVVLHPTADGFSAETLIDSNAGHFMANPSSIGFDPSRDFFATCQEELNDSGGMPVMGPTLWAVSTYAKVNQNGEALGSHMDMLHESPLCMGIAHEHENAFWVFDGHYGQIVFYDFGEDHGPGADDHADGVVRRFVDATVTRLPGIASHLVLDAGTGLLYVADTGAGRVMVLDVQSGNVTGTPDEAAVEPLAEYSRIEGAAWDVFAENLAEPSGIALGDGRLYVGEHGSGHIVVFELDGTELGRIETGALGLMGLAVSPEQRLWYVDAGLDEVVRLDP